MIHMFNPLQLVSNSGRIVLSALALLLAACAPMGVNQPSNDTVALRELPGWSGDNLAGLRASIDQQCKRVAQAPNRFSKDWPGLCAQLPLAGDDRLKTWLEANFTARIQRGVPQETADAGQVTGLLTGYYEPLVQASRTASASYLYPLYQKPKDLLTVELGTLFPSLRGQRVRGRLESRNGQDLVVPYYTRAQIETSEVLKGQELLFLNDRADAFFLEIQGSGRARLPDGQIIRVGYADQNGHPYRAIGRLLIDKGALTREQTNALAIKQWVRANPKQADEILHANASQVFFRELPALEGGNSNPNIGPPGSLGVPLTPMRSIAIDPRRVAMGSLVWITARTPSGALNLLTLAQDTGGAITGPIRADLFTGFGEAAEQLAATLNAPLQLYVLEPNTGASTTKAR
jgi:membrane-bound lytic murein transglycosylase A